MNIQSFTVLGVLKCVKLANNVIKVTNKGPGTYFSKKSEEIGQILVKIIARLLLVKWYDNKMVKSPFNCVIFPLTQPQVANQQKKIDRNLEG